MTAHAVLLLHPDDTIVVACRAIQAGETVDVAGTPLLVRTSVALGHKLARTDLRAGDRVFRYGAPIGSMTHTAQAGEHVHLHNLQSDYLHTYTLDSGNDFVTTGPTDDPPPTEDHV
ncbi:altronate hydrolase [Deinococcus sp. KSM4-11]|uniref:UxaA family hydrolase n=1 Tax=Deinococcus sp. KSM4-11 TaxID=2568654 RepID=UPI0010A4BC11|nr:UxaA family hydrolase [Deinococcus sp. KSM4-11]THF87367.1 altronate hydrolase [Deinococcus sp. KSM4-11]